MPPQPAGMPKRSFTVFEAANEDLKEIYVTWTSRPIFEAMSAFGKQPPKVLSNWKTSKHRITFRSLEFDLTEELARSFVSRHVSKQPLHAGWKFILDSPASD